MTQEAIVAALAAAIAPIEAKLNAVSRELRRLRQQKAPGLLLNTTEAARLTGRSRWTINHACDKGELRYKPRGKKGKLIPREELERWARAGLVSTPEHLKEIVQNGRRVA